MKNYTDIRDAIFDELYNIALNDKKVVIISVDTGAMIFKKMKENIPLQFYNVGIAEQNAMSVAAGLALTGHHVFIFGIANFVTLRCFEQIKIDVASMNASVTILASATGYFYGEDGPTHHMTENLAILRTLPGFTIWSPSCCSMAASLIHKAYETPTPNCIYFDRGPFQELYEEDENDFSDGVSLIKPGKDLIIISTGVMVQEALCVADKLEEDGIDVGVVDIYRLKPLNEKRLLELLKGVKRIATLEEHTISGGLGGLICEFLAGVEMLIPIKIFGIPDIFQHKVGDRDELRLLAGIDVSRVVGDITKWLKS